MDLKQFFAALRRSWVGGLLIVVVVTGIVAAASFTQPKKYKASSKIVLRSATDSLAPTDVQVVVRRLATIQQLLTTPNVLQRAAQHLPGETVRSLQGAVTASAEQNANIINVNATASTAGRAAAIANVVAATFLSSDRAAQLGQVRAARAGLLAEVARETQRLAGEPAAVVDAQLQSLRQRISDLDIEAASAGQDLQIAQQARPPAGPYSPSPVRNAFLAFLASLFLVALAAYARARLEPRLSGARELSRLTDIPILATVPPERVRRRNTGATSETGIFQSLQALVRLQLPERQQHRILVTSASSHASQAAVTAGLARAFASHGNRTLVMCSNFGDEELERQFGLANQAGLSEAIQSMRSGADVTLSTLIESAQASLNGHASEALRILPSGHESARGDVLAGDEFGLVFKELQAMAFDYVLVDAPPLRAIAETRILARHVDSVLVVANPEYQSPDDATHMRALLAALPAKTLGLVVVGATDEASSRDYVSHAES